MTLKPFKVLYILLLDFEPFLRETLRINCGKRVVSLPDSRSDRFLYPDLRSFITQLPLLCSVLIPLLVRYDGPTLLILS